MSVCLGVKVEDLDIKKCPSKSTTPESASRDVGACTILSVGRCTCKCLITDWLQGQFKRHIVAYDQEKVGGYISNFVVSYCQKTSFWAGEGMIYRKVTAIGTVGRRPE